MDQCLPAGQVLEGLGDLEGPDPKAIQRVLCIYIYILSVQFCHVFLAVENMRLHICLKFKSTKYTSFSHIYMCVCLLPIHDNHQDPGQLVDGMFRNAFGTLKSKIT